MICPEDGGVVDDLIVYRDTEDTFLVVANASNATTVAAAFAERTAGFDVTVEDRSPQTALIAVQGPLRWRSCGAPGPPRRHTTPALKYYAAIPMTVAGRAGLLARTGYTGEDGFEFFLDAALAPALWQAFLAAGEPFGLVPAGLSARDSLRLEAGMPLYGNELTRTTTPHDAGLGRVVKLEKVDDRAAAPVRRPRALEAAGSRSRPRARRARRASAAGRPATATRCLDGRRHGRLPSPPEPVADPRPPGRDGLRDAPRSAPRAPSWPSTCADGRTRPRRCSSLLPPTPVDQSALEKSTGATT